MYTKIIVPTFLLTASLMMAQGNMNPGFELLEAGSFDAAESYFGTYLESNPENKTAQICYGRAVGLSGEPKKAITIFSELLEEYPSDFEVQINYNEAYLWDHQYSYAKPLYANLVASNPTNFAALLGYANTLSNLKEYAAALDWVNKALLVEPKNLNAKTSRKYIKLGYANFYVTNQQYGLGEQLLKEILLDFPEDTDALLNLANLYLITKNAMKAKSVYMRIADSSNDSIVALNGIALAEHIGKQDKKALKIAKMAKTKAEASTDSVIRNRTSERYIQALIWNGKYRDAAKQIDSLERVLPKQLWIRSLKATMGMYTADFKTSLQQYNAILEIDSTSFDGNLGSANALFASDEIGSAYKAAFKTLDYYENQKDAQGFIEKLNSLHTPILEDLASYTFDNGNNVAYSNTITGIIPFS
ncbi:MAG: tetratricopeptide repeat protein, partial [Muriicola sp.]|nr:tetratricopeptide repeat protein [Muriicola sp.]